jgi:hypothetical protein
MLGACSLHNKLHCHQSRFETIRTSLGFDNADQVLEMLHILCVDHVVGLIVQRHSVLHLLEGPRALLVVIECGSSILG